jgi:erythronate-4-phosphate dehydrogenase
MKIVADQNIPFLRHYFSAFGDILAVDGRDITPAQLRDADALLVRTVTRVDSELLAGSRVRFVGSPTSGIDHLDTVFLERAGIPWAAAPGCNARSVAEYVLSAICVLTEMHEIRLSGMRAGIIGCGHAGSWTARLLGAAGVECVLHDPPLQENTGEWRYRPLEEALDADIVTLHVPLTRDGPYPTAGMVDSRFLSALRPDALLVNTARGEVVDEQALIAALRNGRGLRAIIDVWRHEPDVNAELLGEADVATPHIAGYSTDARLRASATVAMAMGRILAPGLAVAGDPALPGAGAAEMQVGGVSDPETAVRMAVLSSYDVRSDAIVLRRLLQEDDGERRRGFLEARNHYPLRREFPAHRIVVARGAGAVRTALAGLGFSIQNGG